MLGTHGLALELGQADGREQDGVGLSAGRERLVGQRVALREDRVASERVLGVPDPECVEHADRLGRDLGPDPVAWQDGDVVTRRVGALVRRDLVLVLEREPDVVEAVQEAIPRRLVELERRTLPGGRVIVGARGRRSSRTLGRVDRLHQRLHLLPAADVTRPILAAFVRKMSPNDDAIIDLEAVVLQAPRRRARATSRSRSSGR